MPRRKLFFLTTIIVLLLVAKALQAEVVRIQIDSRQRLADGQVFGRSGSYEKIIGKLYLQVDPDDKANQRIIDLKFAERSKEGKVEFWTEFELLKPVDPLKGNRRLLYLVNNRGNKLSLQWAFHAGGGENWLYRQGYSVLWCGWNGDVPPLEDRVNIALPIAYENGKSITGKIYSEICAQQEHYSPLFYRDGETAYHPISLDNYHATLTMQRRRGDKPIELPRQKWAFARLENGKVIPDPIHLYVKEGFRKGWLYDLVYVGKNPRVTGLGLAAVRDVVSFFRYETSDKDNSKNPLAGVIERSFAFGISQSGRFINHFVYEDFNGDEKGRIVFDAVCPNVAGAGRGFFNARFAQTTRYSSPHEDHLYPIDVFPFATIEQVDPVTGKKGNRLERARKSGFLPKIFFTNTSTEYWCRAGSLLHTDLEGKQDLALDPNVRLYVFAGRTHVDVRNGPLVRALLVALDEWVSCGIEPPPSCYPKITDGTLVDYETWRENFPKIPGEAIPEGCFQPVQLELGPRWETEGIVDNTPPKAGKPYRCLVPAVNKDGNELAGIRLPDIAVPLGTYAGWKVRGPEHYAPGTLERWVGTNWPFCVSPEQRKEKGDPRPSIWQRYPTRQEYLSKVADAVLQLKKQRFLLEEDAIGLLAEAAAQPYWDN